MIRLFSHVSEQRIILKRALKTHTIIFFYQKQRLVFTDKKKKDEGSFSQNTKPDQSKSLLLYHESQTESQFSWITKFTPSLLQVIIIIALILWHNQGMLLGVDEFYVVWDVIYEW